MEVSPPFLDVLPGLEIARLSAGVPAEPDATRLYTLRTLNRDRVEVMFLRIDDDDRGVCYGVFELGRIVRLYEPKLQVDETGNVHILHQSGPWQFTHSVFTPRGEPVLQEVYSGEGSAIGLKRGEGGQLAVDGGQLYVPGDEEDLEESDDDFSLPETSELGDKVSK